MKIARGTASGLTALTATLFLTGCAHDKGVLISQDEAIDAALQEVGTEVLGVRFDAPDTQWDVFVQSGDQACEVEVDARSGKIIAIEEEALSEIEAELSGDLSHEGIDGDVD